MSALFTHEIMLERVTDQNSHTMFPTLRAVVFETDTETGFSLCIEIVEFRLPRAGGGVGVTSVIHSNLCKRWPDATIHEKHKDVDLGRTRILPSKLLRLAEKVARG